MNFYFAKPKALTKAAKSWVSEKGSSQDIFAEPGFLLLFICISETFIVILWLRVGSSHLPPFLKRTNGDDNSRIDSII